MMSSRTIPQRTAYGRDDVAIPAIEGKCVYFGQKNF